MFDYTLVKLNPLCGRNLQRVKLWVLYALQIKFEQSPLFNLLFDIHCSKKRVSTLQCRLDLTAKCMNFIIGEVTNNEEHQNKTIQNIIFQSIGAFFTPQKRNGLIRPLEYDKFYSDSFF